jgi:nicotinamidase-related amidase
METTADSLDPRRTGLLFFDTSKMFVNGPSLKAQDRQPHVVIAVRNWERQIIVARQLRMLVAFAHTAQRIDKANYFPRLIDRVPPGHERRPMTRAVFGTEEVSVIDELKPAFDEYMYWKDHWDPWQGTSFELALRRRGVDTIIVNGGSTQIGIAATAYGAHRLDFDIIFVSDGCTTGDEECQEMLMTSVFPRIGLVRTTDEVLAMLQASPG